MLTGWRAAVASMGVCSWLLSWLSPAELGGRPALAATANALFAVGFVLPVELPTASPTSNTPLAVAIDAFDAWREGSMRLYSI